MNTSYNNSRSKKLPKHQPGVPVPAAQQQVQDATVGAPLSNTAPSNCIEGNLEYKILRTGVDSLYLSYAGSLKAEVEEKLESLKTLAQSSDPIDQANAFLCVCDHRFEVSDKGKGRYPFVI